jgi:hypothetical protein
LAEESRLCESAFRRDIGAARSTATAPLPRTVDEARKSDLKQHSKFDPYPLRQPNHFAVAEK